MSQNFSTEPVIGHHVSAERYQRQDVVLDQIAESYGIPNTDRERVRITIGDVDWDETQTISMRASVFEQIIEWYEETQ